jgi:hypothetical protein
MTLAGVIAATLAAIAVKPGAHLLARPPRAAPAAVEAHGALRLQDPARDPARTRSIVALFIRLTPGPRSSCSPTCLGLAEVPFRLYMIVSWLCILPWAVAFVVLGKGVFNGNFKLVIYGRGRHRRRDGGHGALRLVRKRYVSKPASIELGGRGPGGPAAYGHGVHPPGEGGARGRRSSPAGSGARCPTCRVQPSGHVYFSLKDAGAQLSAVMFRAQAAMPDREAQGRAAGGGLRQRRRLRAPGPVPA